MPVFLSAGRSDPIVPVRETERLGKLFRGYGADVSISWHGRGHELGEEGIRAAQEWLARASLV